MNHEPESQSPGWGLEVAQAKAILDLGLSQRHEVTEMNRKQHFSTMENLQKIESCLPIDTL